ncbi:YjcZ family sporulation protein [Bacillus sp. MM2020_1]|nr:YjcZ family sporulation protein [Bacillus sp. MM2020_1]
MLSGQNYPVSHPWSGSFAIIVVLFILLIFVDSAFVGQRYY